MKLFLRDNKGYVVLYYLGVFITLLYIKLKGFISMGECIYIFVFNTFILACFLFFRYYKNKEVYNLFNKENSKLDEYLIDLGDSVLSDGISNTLKNQHKLYQESLEECNNIYNEHLTFVNNWAHQMKTPLSVMELQLHEYEGEEPVENIRDEVVKLNKGLNMALYFARLSSFQQDFVVEKVSLYTLVMDKINEERKLFIKSRVIPKVEIDKSVEVYSDAKWLKFTLEQIITNGVKYSKDKGKYLTLSVVEDDKYVRLSITDKGVGIPNKDIKRVFDAFFTGSNGRKFGESTGMGLYMVKKVCDNLGHKVEIESKINEGAKVTILFKK